MAEAAAIDQAARDEARARRLRWRMLVGFLAGLAIGLAVHYGAPGAAWVEAITTYVTGPLGQIFLRLLFMLVIPLLVSALIVGVAEMGEMRALKSVGVRTLVYTIAVSSIAVAISLAVVNALQPGAGVDPALARALMLNPRILLVDEPSVGLSSLLVSRTIDAIGRLKEHYKLTVLMAEQNFTQALRIADRGYVIVHGKIEFEGNSADELNNNDLIRQFYLGMCIIRHPEVATRSEALEG